MAKRILVVENQQGDRELLRLILSTHGYAVDTAGNVREARDIATARPPDALLVDAVLPDKNGWDFCEELKHVDLQRAVPVLVISNSHVSREDMEGSCADACLVKPVDEQELLAKVRHLLP